MASGKYEKNAPKKTIKTYHRYETQPPEKSNTHGKYQQQKVPKYKSPSGTMQKIFALAAVGFIAVSLLKPISPEASIQEVQEIPSAKAVSVEEYKPEIHTLEIVEPEILYTLGIANYDAEITVDGKSYPIGNSFVIASENDVIVSDVHGNFLKGQIGMDSFKKIAQLTENEMSNFNYYQVTSDSPANVRSSGEISDDNIISTVAVGDYVLAYKAATPEYDGEWLKTLSIYDGNLYAGYMREDVLQEIGAIEAVNYRTEQSMKNMNNLVMVDTSKDDYISLKLRTEPGQDVVTEIPYGSFLQILGQTKQYGNKSWNLVNYETPDGEHFQGWVASKYLTNEVVQEQPGPKVVNGVHLNATGNVTGIDVSTLSPDVLREILQNGISERTRSVHGTFDTSQLAGKIGYVYIKIGASTYGNGKLATLDYDNYIEQVAVCEELGVPYGFYYYSTAINVEEANMELNCIQERIEDLRQRYDMKNNLLEIAVDVELSDSRDRQYRGNIQEQTEAKAALINGIQEQNLSNKVLIYGPGRVMQPDLDQIFDLGYLSTLLSNPEDVGLWQCSLMDRNGNQKSDVAKFMYYAQQFGFDTTMCQSGLDLFVESNNKVLGLIDVNNMDFNHFNKLINKEKTKENITYTLEFEQPNEDNKNEKPVYSLKHNTQSDDELEL